MSKPRIRYQVFVSSTYKDLQDERQAAVEAILRAGHIPAGMELFAAQNKPQMEVIREWIEESDIFCLILGARYGSIEPESKKSYVECEYEHAVALKKPIFSLVLDEKLIDANLSRLGRKVVLEQDSQAMLKAFHSRITSTLVRMVSSTDSIKVAVFEAIGALERGHEIEGWIRSKDARASPQMAEELARLSAENAKISKDLAAASASREELVEGKSINEWASILARFSTSEWDDKAGRPSATSKITLHSALLRHGHQFGAGVANNVNASQLEGYLFGVASGLMSFGLVDAMKVPAGVHWQRLALSAAGRRLYSGLMAQQSRGEGVMAVADIDRELLKQFRAAFAAESKKRQDGTEGVRSGAPVQPPDAEQNVRPPHSTSNPDISRKKAKKKGGA